MEPGFWQPELEKFGFRKAPRPPEGADRISWVKNVLLLPNRIEICAFL
jgi:hypothetical protein